MQISTNLVSKVTTSITMTAIDNDCYSLNQRSSPTVESISLTILCIVSRFKKINHSSFLENTVNSWFNYLDFVKRSYLNFLPRATTTLFNTHYFGSRSFYEFREFRLICKILWHEKSSALTHSRKYRLEKLFYILQVFLFFSFLHFPPKYWTVNLLHRSKATSSVFRERLLLLLFGQM